MPSATAAPLLSQALSAARETRACEIGQGILGDTPALFRRFFQDRPAAIITDANTWHAAGQDVYFAFKRAGHKLTEPFIYTDPDLYAEMHFVDQLTAWLSRHDGAIPVPVGAGTLNDLAKLAAHRTGRQYLVVATAASMDGYTAFGSSITDHGSKQTFDCPAPLAVLADLDVIAKAPPQMTASGYADLLAKLTAGADWIVADALDIESIDPTAWSLVQTPLMDSLAHPEGIPTGELRAVSSLTTGLMMGGFAMQWTKTSRPASGAEHQFSHLWDMQHHVAADGWPPSHGFKVAVATLAVAHAYDHLLTLPLENLDVDAAVRAWPTDDQVTGMILALLGRGELADKGTLEMSHKRISPDQLRGQLQLLKKSWPDLKRKLRAHLPPAKQLENMLATAGAPTKPEQIGIPADRLRTSFKQAYLIRRRFTVLDLMARTNTFGQVLAHLFSPEGPYRTSSNV